MRNSEILFNQTTPLKKSRSPSKPRIYTPVKISNDYLPQQDSTRQLLSSLQSEIEALKARAPVPPLSDELPPFRVEPFLSTEHAEPDASAWKEDPESDDELLVGLFSSLNTRTKFLSDLFSQPPKPTPII